MNDRAVRVDMTSGDTNNDREYTYVMVSSFSKFSVKSIGTRTSEQVLKRSNDT
jgi:hypothetical protein